MEKYNPTDTILETHASVRLRNALRAYAGHVYDVPEFPNLKLETLATYSERQFLRIRNLGKNSADELKEILQQAGLRLK